MSISLEKIDLYIDALIDNAEQLIFEAEVLYKVSAYSRAYALAHFAREELSKCMILYAAGRRVVSGINVDWKRTLRRLKDHKSKLRQEIVKNSIIISAIGDKEQAEAMIANTQLLAEYRNDRKNTSIYVGLEEGEIIHPSTAISESQAKKVIKLAKMALEDEKIFRSKVGYLVDLNPEELPDITNWESLDQNMLVEKLKEMGSKYRAVMKALYPDE